MALSPERSEALKILRDLLQTNLKDVNKTTSESLASNNILGQGVGSDIMSRNVSDMYKQLMQTQAELVLQEAKSKEDERRLNDVQSYESTERDKDRQWQDTVTRQNMKWQEDILKKKKKDDLTKSLTSLGTNVLTGGAMGALNPSLFGDGTSWLSGLGKGALYGGENTADIFGQKQGQDNFFNNEFVKKLLSGLK